MAGRRFPVFEKIRRHKNRPLDVAVHSSSYHYIFYNESLMYTNAIIIHIIGHYIVDNLKWRWLKFEYILRNYYIVCNLCSSNLCWLFDNLVHYLILMYYLLQVDGWTFCIRWCIDSFYWWEYDFELYKYTLLEQTTFSLNPFIGRSWALLPHCPHISLFHCSSRIHLLS